MFGRVGTFFSETKQELAKVNWPSRSEVIDSTIMVVVVTLLVAAFIFGVDMVISVLLRTILR